MRKISLVLCLVVLAFVLSGCNGSGNKKNAIKRTSNIKNDEIKVLGLDWLAEKNEIEEKFNTEYGKETYISEKRVVVNGVRYEQSYFPTVTDYPHPNGITRTNYVYYGSGKKSSDDYLARLNWNVDGHLLTDIDFFFLSNDNGKSNFLYSASLEFDDITRTAFNNFIQKLNQLYTQTDHKRESIWESYEYRDTNNNRLHVVYYTGSYMSQRMRMDYTCGDMRELVNKLIDDEDAYKEEREKKK